MNDDRYLKYLPLSVHPTDKERINNAQGNIAWSGEMTIIQERVEHDPRKPARDLTAHVVKAANVHDELVDVLTLLQQRGRHAKCTGKLDREAQKLFDRIEAVLKEVSK